MKKLPILGFYSYWVVLTYLGVMSAVAGIYFALEGNIKFALLSLMVSGVCDLFDGTVARRAERTDREKAFGIQIDSLADIIAFGILPTVIGYAVHNAHGNPAHRPPARYGVYACLGNHDGGETLDEMLSFLERSNIKLLADEYVTIDERLILAGRLDPSPIGGFGDMERKDLAEVMTGANVSLPRLVCMWQGCHFANDPGGIHRFPILLSKTVTENKRRKTTRYCPPFRPLPQPPTPTTPQQQPSPSSLTSPPIHSKIITISPHYERLCRNTNIIFTRNRRIHTGWKRKAQRTPTLFQK